MRKTFNLMILTILLFILIPCSALAEEITFRGLPWYTGISAIKAEFEGKGMFADNVDYPMIYASKFDGSLYSLGAEQVMTRQNAGYLTVVPFFPEDFRVAGYSLEGLYMFSCYGLDGEKVLREEDASRLYLAFYKFDVMDIDGAYSDLKTKLTSLYGAGEEACSTDTGYILENGLQEYEYTKYQIKWEGNNNTAVVMTCAISPSSAAHLGSTHYLTLTYEKTDSDAMVQAVSEAVEKEMKEREQEAGTMDVSGL